MNRIYGIIRSQPLFEHASYVARPMLLIAFIMTSVEIFFLLVDGTYIPFAFFYVHGCIFIHDNFFLYGYYFLLCLLLYKPNFVIINKFKCFISFVITRNYFNLSLKVFVQIFYLRNINRSRPIYPSIIINFRSQQFSYPCSFESLSLSDEII